MYLFGQRSAPSCTRRRTLHSTNKLKVSHFFTACAPRLECGIQQLTGTAVINRHPMSRHLLYGGLVDMCALDSWMLYSTCISRIARCLNTPPTPVRLSWCYPPVPASGKTVDAPDPEETFSWKNVLKDVLRLRKEDKLSEGILCFQLGVILCWVLHLVAYTRLIVSCTAELC